MPCIDAWLRNGLAVLGLVAGCSTDSGSGPAGSVAPTASERHPIGAPAAPHPRADSARSARSALALPAPHAVRNWTDVRLQAAERMIAANPGGTYTGVVPETLLAIPVLEIELNGDGSVRRIVVLRHPRQAKDTTEIAIDAVRGAAPFGNVSRLPRPWKFVETFLFDDARRFKPRTLEH